MLKLHRVFVFGIAALAAVLALGGVASATGVLDPGNTASDVDPAPQAIAASGPTALMLQLDGRAAAAVPAAREEAQAAANADLQADVAAEADAEGLIDSELFRVGVAYNGVAVIASPSDAEQLGELPGVKSVVEIPAMEPTNSRSVPYIGGDVAWGSIPAGLTGQGIKIGIIDSGVDYLHADFGGPGTPAAYTDARAAAANPPAVSQNNPGFSVSSGGDQVYPSAKVVGGFDFVGDNYGSTPSAPAVPDPNPLDCGTDLGGSGHGTHVAGTATGLGVEADGSTFTGDYRNLDPTGMRIGPGVAPGAELYALRVFGCGGSTNMVIAAIDWAMDPNRDGSTADHLDVVNMSLGSDFGMPDDPTAKAASNASEAGVAMVISAGNSGNTSNISGSPASSPRALTVANGNTGSHTDVIEVSGSGGAADGVRDVRFSANFPWEDLSAPVSAPVAWANETGCSALSSGTYSGKIALLRWSSNCGSAVRSNSAEAAGAVGAVLLDDVTSSTISIAGNATLPTAYAINPVASDLIAAATGAGATVTFDPSLVGGFDDSAAGTLNDSSSRGPGTGDAPKPDITAPGTDIRSAKSGTGDYVLDLTGTSMAAPHVAGAMALLREAKPGWSVEDLKAAAMNTADPDIKVASGLAGAGDDYPPQRVGTGMIDVPAALETEVVAMASPGSGEVSLGFGSLQVPLGEPFQRDETVTVTNHGGASQTYSASFIARSAPTGVNFSVVGGSSVVVPANGSTPVTVRISIPDPSQLRNDREATLAPTQTIGSTPTARTRRFDVDASGLLRLESTSAPGLSVPVHANVRPASDFHVPSDVTLEAGATTGSVPITGDGPAMGPNTDGFQSRASALELQALSPRATLGPGVPEYAHFADIRAVGVADEGGYLVFGIQADAPNPQPASYGRFEVNIDNDGDGDPEYIVYTSRWTQSGTSAPASDIFSTAYYNVDTQQAFITQPLLPDGISGYGEFGSAVTVLAIPAATVGVGSGNSDFQYTVEGYANRISGPIDAVGPLTWDRVHPAVTPFSSYLFSETAGPLQFNYDAAVAAQDGALGMLVLHHMNTNAEQAEVVRIHRAPAVDDGGPYSGNEGQTITLDASGSTDPDNDPLAIDWDLNDDGTYETSGATTPVALADGPATRTVGLRVRDGNSDPVERDVPINVENVAPTIALSPLGNPPAGVRITTSDPSGPDRTAGFIYKVDVGANGSIDTTVTGTSPRDVPLTLPVGSTPVRVTATDKDGGISAPQTITLTKTAPPVVKCVVPALKGKTRRAARRALEAANCTLGSVKKPKSKKGKKAKGKLVVARQSKRAGAELPEDSAINVKLRQKKRK